MWNHALSVRACLDESVKCLHLFSPPLPTGVTYTWCRTLLQGHEQLAVRNENAYLPFGAGARLCIGWRFALQETRMVLVKLYQHFTFELTPGQVPLEVSTHWKS